MTRLWDLIDAASPTAFYGAIGALLIAFAIIERAAQRRRLP